MSSLHTAAYRSFDYAKWLAKLIFPPSEFKQLSSYVLDGAALREHLKSNPIVDPLDPNADIPSELRDHYTAGVGADLDSSVSTLARQLVVLSATYCEAFLREFFQALFLAHGANARFH